MEENFHSDSQKIFEKKILPLYKNTNSPTPTNNGLIGMKQKKIQRLIGRHKPWYKITVKEYSEGKVVAAWIDELNSAYSSVYDFLRDKGE